MPQGKYRTLLKSPGFESFLWTQFLGAFNDNVYKIVVSMLAVNMAAEAGVGSGPLSLVGAVFILPFFLFSGYAGHAADVFSKRSVLVATKVFEIVAMILSFFAFRAGRLDVMLGVLFLMALQATLFSPAKYGILPEFLPDKDLSRANGLLEMSTFVAIVLGTSIGSFLFAQVRGELRFVSFVLVGIAVIGAMTSLGIPKVAPAGAQSRFRLNPWGEILIGIRRLYGDKTLWLTVIGISYFWFLGALLQMDLLLVGKEVMRLDDLRIGLLGTFLAVGIGAGSLVAGRLSGDKVELGLVPLGSIGMGIFSILFAHATSSYARAGTMLSLLGFSGGLFVVPLNALLQQKSGRDEKGRLIATNNFMNTAGILLASGVLWLFTNRLAIPSDRLLLICGAGTLAATVYVLAILPDFLIRFTLWFLTHTIYKIRIVGQEHVPFRGPALLVCNHVSFVDALLVGACVQRFIRFMILRSFYEMKPLNGLFRLMKTIPVSNQNRREVVASLEKAREALREGHVVCIFAEGAISRTGNLLPFKRGLERIVEGADVPVIPVHLDRVWGSIFSFKNGRFFWKRPERIPYPVTVSFGKPLPSTAKAWEVRQAIMGLAGEASRYRRTSRDLLHLKFIQAAKRRWFSLAMADSTGKELTYGKTLVAALCLARWIKTQCPGEKMIGVMVPASIGGALSNIAVLLSGRSPVNLNFTAGREAMAVAKQRCGIQTVLTSKIFLAKAKLEETEGMAFLEDILREISPVRKVLTAVAAFVCPSRLIQFVCGGKGDPDALATVIFTSGSSGVPKGVMLSHHNILANADGLSQIFRVTQRDRLVGILPLFHSFGFTGTLWFPLLSGFGVIYHPNPMDAKTIGETVRRHKATILIATPTFYSVYLRKCPAEDFASLRYAIVGAEKLRERVAAEFKEKFGLELLEGYGCTEMGPVVSVNTTNVANRTEFQTGFKAGTVGHPLPGVQAKIVHHETGETLGCGEEGLMLVKGPNRMMGYLAEPEKTEACLLDGWYVTGDIARMDEDGFLTITDRLSRFSKIGGEMVSHIKIEEKTNEILGDTACVVSSIPDEKKGEKLVMFYAHPGLTPQELWERLGQTDLPKLWIPKRENFYSIEAIPTLGTGKVDFRKIKAMALERAAAGEAWKEDP